MKLHHEVLRPGGREPSSVLVMLHGILGSGGNLRGIARQVIEGRPDALGAVLIDLRAHGQSLAAPGNADTVANAARDVEETLRALCLPVHAVVGHSFGGKVALALEGLPVTHVMTLDSAPGPRPDARGSESTFAVLKLLHALDRPWATRDEFVAAAMQGGQPKPIAQWLAMNLQRGEGESAFRLRVDLKRIDTLIDDYLTVDLWPKLEHALAAGPKFHLVIADRSRVYEHDDRVRAQGLESGGGPVTVDLLEGGHWIHVDNAAAVVEVMRRRL
ncbi:MAG: alpha/beta hydrolase [Myxococcaceae bacterium]